MVLEKGARFGANPLVKRFFENTYLASAKLSFLKKPLEKPLEPSSASVKKNVVLCIKK